MDTTNYNSNDHLTLQLAAQQQQIQRMNESLSLMLECLQKQTKQPNLSPQLAQINNHLGNLNHTMSNMQKDWALRDPQTTLIAVEERLKNLDARSESTRKLLIQQRDTTREHRSTKSLSIRYGSVAVLSSLITAIAVSFMPGGLQNTQNQLLAIRYENQLLKGRLIRMEKHLGVPTP
jgi:hypothetical protein